MAYSVQIDGIDRSTDVQYATLQIVDVINQQVNTCSFTLVDKSGNGAPATQDEIVIYDADTTKVFAGTIDSIKINKRKGVVSFDCECRDYTALLDSNLVVENYQDKTDQFIIEDIISRYGAGLGITVNNVNNYATIDQITFNYLQPSQCIQKIAELTGSNWYIDYDKDVHYFTTDVTSTPFDIDSSQTNYYNLEIVKDSSQIKNRVYVRGGTYLSNTFTYETIGDGTTRSFILPDKPHELTFSINAASQTVGIKNIHSSGYDAYLNYNDKYVELDDTVTTPTASDTLTFTYKYDIPILVAVEDTESINTYGQKEFAIFDKEISTTQAARERASAELTDYASQMIEGQFITRTPGFFSGQTIDINLSDYGVNASYIVQQVTAISTGAGTFEYTIKLASAKTVGIIKFLIKMLEANKQLVELNDDEVVDELLSASDALISDSLLDSLVIDSQGEYFTWADSPEDTSQTRMRWDLFQWG